MFEFGAQVGEALCDLLFGRLAVQARMQRAIGLLQHIDIGQQRRAACC
ncbi:hypothetical protein FHY18_003677 [Xanthomonas arboricola]|nr:hypothetical protein [Xanthomonas sp. 3793]